MAADNTSPPGPDAGIDDIQADIEQTRKELGETVEALTAKADVKARAKQRATDTKARLIERAQESRDVVIEKAHAAQSTARHAVTDSDGSVKRGVPFAALVATAVIIGVVLWRRRH